MQINAPLIEVEKKQFVYEDKGGTAVRGKIRIDRKKEDRRYEDAVNAVKNNY
jgi:hypothetical protein